MKTLERNICIIANEPTPYNTDLFNAFSDSEEINLTVVHTTAKIWTSSHDYREFPEVKYNVEINLGKGFFGKLKASISSIRAILRPKQVIIIAGYVSLSHIVAILMCIILKIPFALWTDQFNVGEPLNGGILKKIIRDWIRSLIFNNAFAIMVSGKPGLDSATKLGCSFDRLINFPYVVNPERLKRDYDPTISIAKQVLEKAKNRIIIFFSGRLMPRKGLDVLLKAFTLLCRDQSNVFLIIEGEGTLREEYEKSTQSDGISQKSFFVGFRQMKEHTTLAEIADIIVVPSFYDPWGLVVHEGMLLGKPVIASDHVGSAIDRIRHGENGFIFKSGDHNELAKYLMLLSSDPSLRRKIGEIAQKDALQWTPERNVISFLSKVIEKKVTN